MTDSIDFDNLSDIDMEFMNAADISFDRSTSSTSPSLTPMTASSKGKKKQDELEAYLTSPVVHRDTDVLQ